MSMDTEDKLIKIWANKFSTRSIIVYVQNIL